MQFQPVDSSAIKEIGYDEPSKTLRLVWHSGSVSDHQGVTPARHQAMLKARSKGQHFHRFIREQHPGVRVEHSKSPLPKAA